ncbi:ribonuclease p mrp subunit pop7 protein [Diplodia corticola]|uniref:Ribonuclease p mrp subunit pop7 protein n=1 Tax=Diplodia corticola TaxID=236234 RepID=A0A1J9RBM0_9PEZI|nr:ribonuclease p mrp subunit pop7 protein [Diplodia corticola]OJD37546.1 ribonuclease p mrp subunit pop7 protein [Diplodia corticola]
MASATSESRGASVPLKLPRLPAHADVQKRPLMHPPIPSPYKSSDSPKIVYVGTKTPFISAVKRVRSLLKEADKRATQSALSQKKHRQRGDPILAAAKASIDKEGPQEGVTIKATGKAIEKATELALFFQQQEDCRVTLRTGTVDAIDDIVEKPSAKRKKPADDDEEEELPETRIRKTSVLEVIVTLR